MPKASPALSSILTPRTTIFLEPGGTTITCSADSFPVGAGNDIVSASFGIWLRSWPRRSYWPRANVKPFQVPTSMSIGASALPRSKEPAIIMPGEISWRSASSAPSPSSKDCITMRNVLDRLCNKPAERLASVCSVSTWSKRFSWRCLRSSAMPMAAITSEFFNVPLTWLLIQFDCEFASCSFLLVTFSVVYASATITMPAKIAA